MRRAVLDSVAERVLRRPRLVRDRVLSASSRDGLNWVKLADPPLTHPSHRRPHMTYFSAFDDRARLWIRASVYDATEQAWHTELGHDGRWHDVREAGFQHLYAPSWDGAHVYGVVVNGAGERTIGCFHTGDDGGLGDAISQEWEGLDGHAVLHDVRVLRVSGRLQAWVSVGASESRVAIHHWGSVDGKTWAYGGEALRSPMESSYSVADNPSVVGTPEGGFRMFFRTGTRPALGNVIRSARSTDLAEWSHEPGERIAPGGRWDTHGVGFPHVWVDEDRGEWRMLYAGYWGDTPRARETVDHWRAAGESG